MVSLSSGEWRLVTASLLLALFGNTFHRLQQGINYPNNILEIIL